MAARFLLVHALFIVTIQAALSQAAAPAPSTAGDGAALLRPAASYSLVNNGEADGLEHHDYRKEYRPFFLNEGSGKRGGAGDNGFPLFYTNYQGSAKHHGAGDHGPFFYAGSGKRGGAGDHGFPFFYNSDQGSAKHHGATTSLFFHEDAVRVGERIRLFFPPATSSALGLLPRHVAESIPFSTPALPAVLSLLGVAPGSDVAAGMEETLRMCESTALPGETLFCATSLEALVERAAAVLGTSDIRPLTSTLPRAGATLQTYTVSAVRPIEGGSSFVACHDQAYPYTVYMCHTTGPARAYMMEMEGGVTLATVCHTDTSLWSPEHVSFKLLGTKPGGAPVCHIMPYGHIIWAKNVKRSPA